MFIKTKSNRKYKDLQLDLQQQYRKKIPAVLLHQ